MDCCQIILLHHNPSLAYSVLDQFEDSILNDPNYEVLQSKRKFRVLSNLFNERDRTVICIAHCVLNGSYCDVARIVVDFAPPPLVIRKHYFHGEGLHPNHTQTSSISLSFQDHFVSFNHHSLLEFASRNLKDYNLSKCAFIQLFDEKETHQLSVDDELSNVYGFLTRLYSSAFDKAHHIHLFAKHKRDGLYATSKRSANGNHEGETSETVMKMKWMNVYRDGTYSSNKQLRNHQLTSFTSMKILERCLSTIVYSDKVPPMTMYDIGGSLSLISKIRLRLNVAKEIRAYIDPCYLTSDRGIGDLLDKILRTKEKYQSKSGLRTSYV